MSSSRNSVEEDEGIQLVWNWLGNKFNNVRDGLRRRMTLSETRSELQVKEQDEDDDDNNPGEDEVDDSVKSPQPHLRTDSGSFPRSQPIDIPNGRVRDRSAERKAINRNLRPRHWKSRLYY
ncbi:Uncharacterized protein FKW44_009815 [Caligus rogercresseyi]|uniref:Uncharacterized protein n=1 Tax=Caligus rogercresseyi TaxID=217165 RepID=A0A7T8HFR1_CALRO|nr:Uncharacterized protein FKW44_009815 [Caligus rogercresseyi]